MEEVDKEVKVLDEAVGFLFNEKDPLAVVVLVCSRKDVDTLKFAGKVFFNDVEVDTTSPIRDFIVRNLLENGIQSLTYPKEEMSQ